MTDAELRTMEESHALCVKGETCRAQTLLDHFATHAPPMPEWWFNEYIRERHPLRPGQMVWDGPSVTEKIAALAEWSYLHASAMLLERAKRMGR